VAKGYNEEEEIDNHEEEIPIAKLGITRMLLTFASLTTKLYQIDKNIFLKNGYL